MEILQQLKERSDERLRNWKLRLLLYGGKGVGKTTCALTAPPPILLQTFDPGSGQLLALRRGIRSGRVILDDRFEFCSPSSEPTLNDWVVYMAQLERDGVFKEVGTFVLDSLTYWSLLAADYVISMDERNKTTWMQLQNYIPLQQTMVKCISQLFQLPCNVIVIGHVSKRFNEVTKRDETTVALPGEKTSTWVAGMFPDQWLMTAEGSQYRVLIRGDSYAQAVSRAAPMEIASEQPPNIEEILERINQTGKET